MRVAMIVIYWIVISSAAYANEPNPVNGIPRVIDGDTLEVAGWQVHLSDIDAPELNQQCRLSTGRCYKCGQVSKAALELRLSATSVQCVGPEPRPDGGAFRTCYATGNQHIGAWLVRNGYALAKPGAVLGRHELSARRANEGMHSGKFVAPWDWRAGARLDPPCEGQWKSCANQQAQMRLTENELRDCAQCPVMKLVSAGSFMMGSPEEEDTSANSERPVRHVLIPNSFLVSKFEVTFAEWDACVATGGCGGYRPDDQGWGRCQRPVINVSWENAKSYVKWLSSWTGKPYRLLSESEWEYAARAGTTGRYHFGSTLSTDQANILNEDKLGVGGEETERSRTVPVGDFPANSFGLHDMHGNVMEWVEDCYRDDYWNSPTDGTPLITGGHCGVRRIRGGAFDSNAGGARSAARGRGNIDFHAVRLGFRVARPYTP